MHLPLRLLRLGPSSQRHVSAFSRPSPPALPPNQQREFEELQRAAQAPSLVDAETGLALHRDARTPLQPDFEGDTNPLTGEQGGPKQEPIRKWVEENGGDWSFKGRVSDF